MTNTKACLQSAFLSFWHLAKHKQRTMWSRLISDRLEQNVLQLNQTSIAGTTLSTRDRRSWMGSTLADGNTYIRTQTQPTPRHASIHVHFYSTFHNTWFNNTASSVLSIHHHSRGFRMNNTQIFVIFIYSVLIINDIIWQISKNSIQCVSF